MKKELSRYWLVNLTLLDDIVTIVFDSIAIVLSSLTIWQLTNYQKGLLLILQVNSLIPLMLPLGGLIT